MLSNGTGDSIGFSCLVLVTAELLDLAGEEYDDQAGTSIPGQSESVFDLLQRSKDEVYEDTELLVEVTVDNMSEHSMEEVVLTPVLL